MKLFYVLWQCKTIIFSNEQILMAFSKIILLFHVSNPLVINSEIKIRNIRKQTFYSTSLPEILLIYTQLDIKMKGIDSVLTRQKTLRKLNELSFIFTPIQSNISINKHTTLQYIIFKNTLKLHYVSQVKAKPNTFLQAKAFLKFYFGFLRLPI